MNKTLIASLTTLALIGTAFAASGTSMHGTSMAGSMSGTSMSSTMMKVDVNTATVMELEKVPGVGPKLAAEIVKMRPYKNQADLVKKVKGIGKRNIKKLAMYFTY